MVFSFIVAGLLWPLVYLGRSQRDNLDTRELTEF
jgi:hypothetical protein